MKLLSNRVSTQFDWLGTRNTCGLHPRVGSAWHLWQQLKKYLAAIVQICQKKKRQVSMESSNRKLGAERKHFDGLFVEKIGSVERNFWKCMHCGHEIGGKGFPNSKARIHLSGDVSLRNGSISVLCMKAPEEVQHEFAALVRKKRAAKEQRIATQKRAAQLMSVVTNMTDTPSPARRKRRRQGTLPFVSTTVDDDVDLAWAKAFYGLDIPPAKISNILFFKAE